MKQLRLVIMILLRIEALLQHDRAQPSQLAPAAEPVPDLDSHQWMDRRAVMDYLQISERTYYRLKKDGILKCRRIGGRDYFFKPDLAIAMGISLLKGRI